jgi:hypothetical protein
MLRQLMGERRGAITVLSAFAMVAVIGFSALALEFGYGLLSRVDNQRIADIAAYSGALAYNSSGSATTANSAAGNIVALNGLSSSAASSSVVASPSGNGNQAVQVTVTTSNPLMLAKLIKPGATLPVSATAYAEIKSDAPGCIIALSGSSSGVSLTGGATLTASGCAVASNTTITAHACSNTITTPAVNYNTTAPSPSCALVAPAGTSSVKQNHASTADPLASKSAVTSATSRISSVSIITSPIAPTGGNSVTFAYSMTGSLPSGCTTSSPHTPWTVTCTGAGPFNFAAISISGGAVLGLTTTSSSAVLNISGGITMGGGTTAAFGAGTYNIGTTSCSGTNGYSICNTGTALTFGGPSTFVLAGGIYNGGGASLTLGSGSTNSYKIGKASDGNSINAGTSKIISLADATGGSSLFQTAGKIISGGGSCLSIPAAAQHDINGSINGAGGIYLGSGIYTVNGYVALGNGGGGDVSNCPASGTTTGLTGLEVTLVVSGASTVSCNSIASAFCLGAGYSTVNLTAPTSSSTLGSSTAGLAVIGPQSSSNTAAAVFTSGATNTRVSGAFYFPYGAINMSGAAALRDTVDTNKCLMLIGSQVTLANGSAAGSTCTGFGGSSSGTIVSLVQ